MTTSHTLKSIFHFGESAGGHDALALEEMGKKGVLDGARTRAAELEVHVRQLIDMLARWLQRHDSKD